MKKTLRILLIVIGIVILLIILAGIFKFNFTDDDIYIVTQSSPLNTTYDIGGEVFTLVNGKAEKDYAPGSATKNKLSVFGEPVYGDLNNDGQIDAAVLLQNDPGGSGTFYYAVLAINNNGVYKSTNALLLGDRISPQTVEIHDGRAVYNYAERKIGEDFSVPPSIGKSLWINLDYKTLEIGEWVKDFEGEADTSKMNLGMKTWDWIQTTVGEDVLVVPQKPNVFNIKFNTDKTFSAKTDCNGVGGSYITNGSKLVFSQMMSTLMYCENSQEQDYSKMLSEVSGYSFTSRGELILDLGVTGGIMTFR